MKYSVVTLGCRVNQADSLGFEGELLAAGAVPSTEDAADLVIVNTCSVTASADQAARQTIRRLTRINPDVRIVVTGCYATRRPEELRDLPGVLRVVPNDDKARLVSITRNVLHEIEETTAERFGLGDGACGAAVEPGVAGRTAYTLRVQTGCAERCSYCIIPTTRGGPRSVSIEDVLREIERATKAGFKEVILTGVHLGSYGRDLSPRSSLVELLRAITDTAATQQPDGPRLRISSLEPMDCTDEVVGLVATSPIFARHFHLPLQHASDVMLRAMRRPYTFSYHSNLVAGIRARIPGASIGSDVIVGFPGEEDRDFEILERYLATSPLTHLHVFPYSDRPGTVASSLPGKVAGPIVRERSRRLREISERLSTVFRGSQFGTVHRALTIDDGSVAVTGNYLKIALASVRQRNEWVELRVTGTAPLTGEVLI